MARGGRRSGSVGAHYKNRSDMNDGRIVLPPKTVTGQTYGEAKTQLDAQRQTPMASAAPSNVAAPAPAGMPPMAVPQGPVPVMPGSVTPPHAPTERPGEHVMTGASSGPGAGPEVLGQFAPPQYQESPLTRGVGLLTSLGSDVSEQIAALRSALTASSANQATP